jgi:hypothetical protein
MVRRTIEGSWMRTCTVPCASGSYLWYAEPTLADLERIQKEVRDPKPSADTTPVPLNLILEGR